MLTHPAGILEHVPTPCSSELHLQHLCILPYFQGEGHFPYVNAWQNCFEMSLVPNHGCEELGFMGLDLGCQKRCRDIRSLLTWPQPMYVPSCISMTCLLWNLKWYSKAWGHLYSR